MNNLLVTLYCVCLIVVSTSAYPQVWNIGFNPPRDPNQVTSTTDASDQDSSTTTTTVAPQTTRQTMAYFDCLSRCPTTSEYNPICGSDSVSYPNFGKLDCASRCGTQVTMVRAGPCMPSG